MADTKELKERLTASPVYGVVRQEDREKIAHLKCIPELLAVKFGCDPELFIEGAEGTVASDALLPEKGIAVVRKVSYESQPHDDGTIARDGVQVELHPTPYICRAYISNSLTALFKALDAELKVKSLKANFSQVINLTDDELAKLSEQARQLGCMPSHNIYGKPSINVEGKVVKVRSAAGHIHFGSTVLKPGAQLKPEVPTENLIRICDVLLGNTAVLIDRDPAAVERRKLYGRAGEHRTPAHGVEYRTLSNFWLRSYPLMSLMFGLAHTAFFVAGLPQMRKIDAMKVSYTPTVHNQFKIGDRKEMGKNSPNILWDADRVLMEKVDLKRIERAINSNDYNLALENYNEWVRPFLAQIYTRKGLDATRLEAFDHFHTKIKDAGIEYWFPDDPLTHWCNKGDGHYRGWETFAATTIAKDIVREAGGDIENFPKYGFGPPDGNGMRTEATSMNDPIFSTRLGEGKAVQLGAGGQVI